MSFSIEDELLLVSFTEISDLAVDEDNFTDGWFEVSYEDRSVMLPYATFSDVYDDVDVLSLLKYAFDAAKVCELGAWGSEIEKSYVCDVFDALNILFADRYGEFETYVDYMYKFN